MSNLCITVDLDSEVPIDVQLKRQIRQKLKAWKWRRGMRLPTVRQLALELEINANQVSRICRHLEREGYLKWREGVGTWVIDFQDEQEQTKQPVAAAEELTRDA